MSRAPQPQPVFVDIHRNNGRKFEFETFEKILKGRFNESIMQLAFEQFLADCKVYGTACRTYRYAIINRDMFLLHEVFNPSPAGPALAAPVMQPGLQNTNGQTQVSGNQNPIASQLNQPVSNFIGPFDHSKVQNMHYPQASTAQKSASQSRQFNPRAAEFKVGSAVNNLGASAPPLALPTANTAPARPPGLLETQQPHFAPANAHRGFFAPVGASAPPSALPTANTAPAQPPGLLQTQQPHFAPANAHRGFFAPDAPFNARQGHDYPDTIPRSVDKDREAARAVAVPPMLITPYSPILRSTVPAIPQQPQLAPCKPHRVLTLNSRLGLLVDTAIPASLLVSPSPLDLAAESPSFSRQSSRRNSEPRSDTPSHSSSDQPESPGLWGLDHWYRLLHSSDAPSLSSSDQPESPCFWRLDHGYRLPLPPVRTVSKFDWSSYPTAKSSVSRANTQNNTLQGTQNGEADTAPWDALPEFLSGKYEDFYSHLYQTWYRSAPPNSNISNFYLYLQSRGEGLRWFHDRFGLRHPQGRCTTPEPWASRRRSDTVSHHNESPRVVNGMNWSREVAEINESALRTQRWVASTIAAPTSPPPQLHNGEEGSGSGESSRSNILAEVRATVREMEQTNSNRTRSHGRAARP